MISTRGRYALRVIIDLAEHKNGSYIPMKDVAARQEISLKYLERILPDLTKGNIISFTFRQCKFIRFNYAFILMIFMTIKIYLY